MKKIVFLTNHFQFRDGVSRALIGIANLLAENDSYEVTIIPIFKYHESALQLLSPKVKVKPIFRLYFRGMTKVVNILPDALLQRFFIRDYYDIEIAFDKGIPLQVISNNRKKNASQVKIAWLHGYDEGLKQGACYLKMDKVISVSKYNAERLSRELPGVVVDYCYNPINDKEICLQGNEPIDNQRPSVPLFISVGRLSPEKGFARLVECLSRIKNDGLKFNFWLVGDGPQENEINDIIKKNNLEDVVKLFGRQLNPHKYTRLADLFVCSSFSEGYSTSCTEAIMLGVPVITTPVPGAEEIIKDAECGLVTGMDNDSLYSSLEYILQNEGLIVEWKRQLQRTKSKFSLENRKDKLFRVLSM